MSYPAFGKVKTIVLPVLMIDDPISFEDYKNRTGIDIEELIIKPYKTSNGPYASLYISDVDDYLFMAGSSVLIHHGIYSADYVATVDSGTKIYILHNFVTIEGEEGFILPQGLVIDTELKKIGVKIL